ncbi:hypothetical protein ABL78_4706 [Leptomonas seymouri]|uniref:AAA+ ATPase domain-containing protein n=1 Tax=Leptomonas seymouri TaxID=5684 RepID=A0A0N1PDZ4_LEPSE|nr:hypothetical protein ABL78_4706 [Leptomonas seymouri]|eukprot:KPI86233.1 hypothetical protein ABL78_4706 [Leptomonas seymouri]
MPYVPSSSSSLKGSSLVTLFLAAIIPFLFLKLLSFFSHTWPNFVYRLLTSRLERQIATVADRVYPNRIIQDDLMISSIIGYVSYCYVQALRREGNACDAVGLADYEYTFLYEDMQDFDESWVPCSTHYKTLFGRIIASAMELSVVPGIGQAIQVEPGLFVRSLEDKHRFEKKDRDKNEGEKGEGSDGMSHRAQGSGGRASTRLNQIDRLNKYVFYDVRKYAENMDEHAHPPVDGKEDDISSAERPFDSLTQKRHDYRQRNPGKGGAKSESTFYEDDESPRQENFIVIEYRRPLPYERSKALCNAHNTSGVMMEYDKTREAGDVIEGFLARAHGWYLSHIAQRKTTPLMAVYPSPALSMFVKDGVGGLRMRREGEADFSGRCYVLDCATTAADADSSNSFGGAGGCGEGRGNAAGGRVTEEGEDGEAGKGIAAAAPIGPSTIAGGQIGLDGAGDSVQPIGKTFKSLFFPSKAHVLSVVDDFVKERGCYGVPGVVARLNFFLYGAPGTGKTSFVKALAHLLRRNLVVVSMGEILTVDELQKLLQPFELNATGNNFSVRPHQSIYVFEDFDAIGDAWAALMRDQREREAAQKQQARENMASAERERPETDNTITEKKTKASGGEGRSQGELEEDVATASEVKQRTSSSFKDRCGDLDADDSNTDDSDDDAASSKNDRFLLSRKRREELDRTHLTVERFLDLFNGFNLSDSFIAVFTTNHPEKVHPLITSSNMMDVTLDMGMLSDECATEMVEHYFVSELSAESVDVEGRRHLTATQAADLRAALGVFNRSSERLSGALLEKMCVECDTVESLTQRLRAADTWDVINAF